MVAIGSAGAPTPRGRCLACLCRGCQAANALCNLADLRKDGTGGQREIDRHDAQPWASVDDSVYQRVAFAGGVDEQRAGQTGSSGVRGHLV